MRQFKVRDLMINVLPEGGPGQAPLCRGLTFANCAGNTCAELSYVGCAITCPGNVTFCRVTFVADTCRAASQDVAGCPGPCSDYTGACHPGTGALVDHTDFQLENLAILKRQLKLSLTQVEAQERALEEGLQPQTLDEIRQLEEKLTAGLEELRGRKAELERGAPKGGA